MNRCTSAQKSVGRKEVAQIRKASAENQLVDVNCPRQARSGRIAQGARRRPRLAVTAMVVLALTISVMAVDAWGQSPNIGFEPDWWDKQRKAYPDCTEDVNRHQAADEQLKALGRQRPPDAAATNAASEKRTSAYYDFIRCVQSKPRTTAGWQPGAGQEAVYVASDGSRWSFPSVVDRPPSRWILQQPSVRENMQQGVLMGVNAEYTDANGRFPPRRSEGRRLPRR